MKNAMARSTKVLVVGVFITAVFISAYDYGETKSENNKLSSDVVIASDELTVTSDELATTKKELVKEKGRVKELNQLAYDLDQEKKQLEKKIKERNERSNVVSRGVEQKVEKTPKANDNTNQSKPSGRSLGQFQATAYDLSVNSCGKAKGSKGYGITASGFDLSGHSMASARAIAVDPRVIPLGSVVHIDFGEGFGHMNGNYTARDTGSAVKSNVVDIFFGEGANPQDLRNFGRRNVSVTLVK